MYKCTHAGTRYALKKSKNDNPVDEPTQEVCNLVRMRKRKNNLQFFAAWIEFKQAESRYRKDIHSVCILTELLSRYGLIQTPIGCEKFKQQFQLNNSVLFIYYCC